MAKHLLELTNIFEPEYASSIMLTGSTSRGELSWRPKNGSFEILSDYEFFIIGHHPPDEQKRILERIALWESALPEAGPLFHVDISFVSPDELPNLQPCWRHYEARETGHVLFGLDLRELFPTITLDNLDFYELNQILLWRNWQLVMHLPAQILTNADFDDPTYSFLLARNALDLTTWALPHEGHMITGFASRVAFIKENIDRLPLIKKLGNVFAQNIERWLDIKLGRDEPRGARAELPLVLDALDRARAALNTIYRRKPTAKGYPKRALGDFSVRSVAKSLKLSKSHARKLGPRWIASAKLALFAEGLLELLKAANDMIAGKDANSRLSSATKIAKIIAPSARINDVTQAHERWIELRKAFLEFGLFYFPFLRQKANYWRDALDR